MSCKPPKERRILIELSRAAAAQISQLESQNNQVIAVPSKLAELLHQIESAWWVIADAPLLPKSENVVPRLPSALHMAALSSEAKEQLKVERTRARREAACGKREKLQQYLVSLEAQRHITAQEGRRW